MKKGWFISTAKILIALCLCAARFSSFAYEWKGSWISAPGCMGEPNTWLNLQKDFKLSDAPGKAIAHIAADSKYWLRVNGELVVFEGGLKRGPNPADTYYDEIDLAPWLHSGDNSISVLMCYFGRDGFSHKNSGKAGFLFDCKTDRGEEIISDGTWSCDVNEAYMTCGEPEPNYRLSEASILYDARKEEALSGKAKGNAIVVGKAGDAPWNRLVKRPVPL